MLRNLLSGCLALTIGLNAAVAQEKKAEKKPAATAAEKAAAKEAAKAKRKAALEAKFKLKDVDKDGELSLSEFVETPRSPAKPQEARPKVVKKSLTPEQRAELKQKAEERRNAAAAKAKEKKPLGEAKNKAPEERAARAAKRRAELEAQFKAKDTDKSGKLSLAEFMAPVRKEAARKAVR
jgi:Ca2+-binding EF-hand superfamily protein